MVTHDMAEALLLADRVLVMQAGRSVADATPGALLAGEGGAEADALVAVPRDQARRLRALEEGAIGFAQARCGVTEGGKSICQRTGSIEQFKMSGTFCRWSTSMYAFPISKSPRPSMLIGRAHV